LSIQSVPSYSEFVIPQLRFYGDHGEFADTLVVHHVPHVLRHKPTVGWLARLAALLTTGAAGRVREAGSATAG
jgi:hypothetical protein